MNLFDIATRVFTASIKDDVVRQYPKFRPQIEEIAKIGKSGHRFLRWAARQLDAGVDENDLISTLKWFDRNFQKLKERDINQYRTYEDLERAIEDAEEAPERAVSIPRPSGAEVVWENERLIVFRVDTKAASQQLGRGTRWCITMEKVQYFERYNAQSTVHYFIFRKFKKHDNLDKVALSFYRRDDGSVTGQDIRDIKDKKVSERDVVDAIGLDFNKIYDVCHADAEKRPVGLIARIRTGDYTVDELKEIWGKINDELKRAVFSNIDDNSVLKIFKEYHDIEMIQNVPDDQLEHYIDSESSFIREIVAKRIDPSYLPYLMRDEDVDVKFAVARRIDEWYLPQLLDDENPVIRRKAVNRIDPSYLPKLMKDKDEIIREIVAKRIDLSYLPDMIDDKDAGVRQQVARRIDPEYLMFMRDDEDDYVRAIAESRLKQKPL